MKNLILIALASILSGLLNAQTNHIDALIVKTEQQKLLSQRIVKDYLAIGLGVEGNTYRKNIDISMAEFDENCFDFEEGIIDPEIMKKVENAERIWEGFRLIATDDPSKQNVNELLKTKDQLLYQFSDIAEKLKSKTHYKDNATELKLRRAQIVLERIGLYYLSISWFSKNEMYLRDFSFNVKDFEHTLNDFDTHFNNNQGAQSKLWDIRLIWKDMKAIIGKAGNNKFYNKELLDKVEKTTTLLGKIPTGSNNSENKVNLNKN